jgi:hypothetical protein
VQPLVSHDQATTLLLLIKAWESHAQWLALAITRLHQTKEWDAQGSQTLAQVDQDLQVLEVHQLDQADLVLLVLDDLLEQVLLVQLVLVLRVELLDSVVLVEDQVPVAVDAVEVLLVLSVKVAQEMLLRLESRREQNVKNLSCVQRQALVEQLSRVVMAAQ